MKKSQLKISILFFVQFVLFLLLFISIIEISLRFDFIEARLAAPSFGSDNRQFEIQLSRLKSIYEKNESIDCIFVGDSLVWLDLDPISFGEGYKNRTGKEISCFNFGIAGLPASGVSVLTEILVNEFKLEMIVYGLHANAVVVAPDHSDVLSVLETPWVKYKAGEFSLEGWLYEKSYFVRYHEILGRILRFDREALKDDASVTPQNLRGFDPKAGQRRDGISPPNRDDPADRIGFEKYYDYQIYPENLQGVVKVASYSKNGTDVVMVMMPVQKTFYNFFRGGAQDYLGITQEIQESISGEDAIFFQANGGIHIPDDEWWDYSHLNLDGAEHLSYWLGQEIGKLASGSKY